MKLWLIYFESANYCGYGEHCVVRSKDEEDARDIAEGYANEFYHEQDYDQYVDEYGKEAADEEGFWANIQTCEEFDESHESWKYYIDPAQKSFYPEIN